MALISKDWDILTKLGRKIGERVDKKSLEEAGIFLACSTSRREYEEMLNAILEGVRNTAIDQDHVDLFMRAVEHRAIKAEQEMS